MAKKISIRHPHNCSAEDAASKLDALGKEAAAKYGLTIKGDSRSAQVKGRGVSGTMVLDDNHITVDLKLGLPASLVASKVESGIKDALLKHFA